MQSLAGLITVLKKYRVELTEGTPTKLTLKPEGFITTPTTKIYLKLTERDGSETRIYNRQE